VDKKFLPCLCINTRRAANAMTTYYDRNFAGMDISATQFSLMMNIKEIGKTNIKDLTNVVKLDKSTLTRTLAPLIEKGFIYSEQGKNRREVNIALTEDGIRKVDEVRPKWISLQKQVVDSLGGEDEAWDFMNKLIKLQEFKDNNEIIL